MTALKRGLVAAIALFYLVAPVMAQEQRAPPCDKAETVLGGLLSRFGEVPIFEGLGLPSAQVVFTANPRTGTWTLLMRNGPELLCYVLIGEAWRPIPAPVPKLEPKDSGI